MLAMSVAPPPPHLLSRPVSAKAIPSVSRENTPDRTTITPMSSKRPRLSLKTSDLAPIHATSTAGRAGVNVNNTATPTTLNTFSNTFDLTFRSSPVSTAPSPGVSLSRRPTAIQTLPYTLNLPYGVRSILKNSPLPSELRRTSLATGSASPRVSSRRVFFPAPKKVSFKAVLEEEILNKEYTTAHADLSSSSDDESTSSESETLRRSPSGSKDAAGANQAGEANETSPGEGRKRKARATSDGVLVEEERGRHERSRSTSDRRTKRKKRRWEWTIQSGNSSATNLNESESMSHLSNEEQTTEENSGP